MISFKHFFSLSVQDVTFYQELSMITASSVLGELLCVSKTKAEDTD